MQRVYILAPDVPGRQGRKSVTQTLGNIELKKYYEINEKREEKTLKSSMVLSCPLLCLSRCLSLVWKAAVKTMKGSQPSRAKVDGWRRIPATHNSFTEVCYFQCRTNTSLHIGLTG